MSGQPQFPIRQATPEDTLAAELEREADRLGMTVEEMEAAEHESRAAIEPLRLTIPEAQRILEAIDFEDPIGYSLVLSSAKQKLEDWLNAQ